MRTLEEIRSTPGTLLTEDELAQCSPEYRAYLQRFNENRARETACPGHEPVSTGTHEESRRGWHPMKCKHCGKDMSVDSGD